MIMEKARNSPANKTANRLEREIIMANPQATLWRYMGCANRNISGGSFRTWQNEENSRAATNSGKAADRDPSATLCVVA
ncbi:hypothetical protein [Mesorhizobium prunaredense]|nr:hypothetical protein [Mesorhizobium prunaredense]